VYSGAQKPGHWPMLVRKVPRISQGSVATRLRCGGTFNDDFVMNLLLGLRQKNFEYQSAFDKVTGYCGSLFGAQGLMACCVHRCLFLLNFALLPVTVFDTT